jgi:hypothetical protein
VVVQSSRGLDERDAWCREGGRLLFQRPGQQQVKAGSHLRPGHHGVGAGTVAAGGLAVGTHHHREQGLDLAERPVGGATEGAVSHAGPLGSNLCSPRRPSAELSHLVMATSSDGVVLQGAQHPSGRIAHDLPLLVGQLCCSVLHDPGDPWQVMDHPWREPLARRQERMLVVGERAAAGRAPRGGRCHGSEYGPRLGAGPPRGRSTG